MMPILSRLRRPPTPPQKVNLTKGDPWPERPKVGRARRRRLPRFHWALILPVVAGVVGLMGVAALICAVTGVLYGEAQEAMQFVAVGILCSLLGVWGVLRGRRAESAARVAPARAHDTFLAVTLAWVCAATLGCLPYLSTGVLSSVSQAFFEAMSGFTTTGATMIADVDGAPRSLLLWRSFSHLLGGIGIVVIYVAVAPAAGLAAQRVFLAETSALSGGRLTPRIADTAKILVGIYLGLTGAAFAVFWVLGMTPYDAVNHAFSTTATGGFSTHTASIAYFESVWIEVAVIFFMVISGVNYLVYWRLLRGGDIKLQMAEVRAYGAVLVGATALITVSLLSGSHAEEPLQALRAAAFSVTSMMTSTGFITEDFDQWHRFAGMVLLLLFFVGGCAGSTAGGMKVVRWMILLKTMAQEVRRNLEPRLQTPLRIGGRVIAEDVRRATIMFVAVFLGVWALATMILVACGLSPLGAASGAIAALSIMGPGLAELGTTEPFADLHVIGTWTLSACMLIGRLEVFGVLVLLTPAFWRGR